MLILTYDEHQLLISLRDNGEQQLVREQDYNLTVANMWKKLNKIQFVQIFINGIPSMKWLKPIPPGATIRITNEGLEYLRNNGLLEDTSLENSTIAQPVRKRLTQKKRQVEKKEVIVEKIILMPEYPDGRQGQAEFRRLLRKAYANCCAISGQNTPEVLEAAHIDPHSSGGDMSIPNGLLLRSDIHVLFDMGLITIDPVENKIAVSETLRGTDYWDFHGIDANLPEKIEYRPSADALARRWNEFKP